MYHTAWPVVGHTWAIQQLSRSLENRRTRHAYLFTGPQGIGKTTLARAFAIALNCEHPDNRPCGECRACQLIMAGTYADVSIVLPEEDVFRIEQIRALQTQLIMRPVEGVYRVVILKQFHKATLQAMDAILKTLEEPTPHTVLILTTETGDSLLPTIRSRCQTFNLRLLPVAQVRQALEGWGVAGEQAALYAQLSNGRLGWAVNAVNDVGLVEQRSTWLKLLEDILGMTRIGRFGVVESSGWNNDSKTREELQNILLLWQSYWRDALLLAHASVTPIANRDHAYTLEQVGRTVSREDILKALKATQLTMQYLKQNCNVRLAMEVLLLDMPRVKLYASPHIPR